MDVRKLMMMQGGDVAPGRRGVQNPPPTYRRGEPRQMERIGFASMSAEPAADLNVIRGGYSGGHTRLEEATIQDWMARLQNTDGTTGPHWSMDQTTQAMRQRNVDCDPLEFWAAMNMMYSDYLPVAKKANANNIDFYVNMARAFLDDKDAREGKLARYYDAVVE